MVVRFFIPGLLLYSKMAVSQLSVSSIDSLNVNMLNQIPVNLSKLGKARIELKDGSTFSNCTITEVKQNKIVYAKNGSLHDQHPDKVKAIRFSGQPWYLEFDRFNRGYIKSTFN